VARGAHRRRVAGPVGSAYRAMWLLAMFDLPVATAQERRRYTRFRNVLLKDGFMMLQFSVYARHAPSEEAAAVHRKLVRSAVPAEGQVRLIGLTDHQFARQEIFTGKKRTAPEPQARQILLF
jgi:CRISPR-associated protein Cas2